MPQILSAPSPIRRINPDFRCNRISDDNSVELMIQNHSNFQRSGSPLRIMYYNGESWVDFPLEVVDFLRSGFKKKNPVIEGIIGGANYLFDFLRMVQTDLESWNQRSIAWIDEDYKCFFPKVFIAEECEEEELEDSESQTIEIDGLKGRRKRERVDVDAIDAGVTLMNEVDNTKRQRLTSQVSEISKWPNAKLITEKTSLLHLAVSNGFLSAITKVDRGTTITAIYQCLHSGPVEKARLRVFQRQNEITKATRGSSNAVYAWFAASDKTVAGILTHGFGAGLPARGVDVYLSPAALPQLSAMQSEVDDNGEKHIILCRVILGNVEKVEVGSQQRGPSSEDYDTGADDPRNPRWYVIWSTKVKSHILPEYVVSYKPSAQVTGHVAVANCTKVSVPRILSKMETRLPSSQLQQLFTAHATFKAGKMTKEKFIQQLRAYAGDQVIMSTIREIQSSG